MKIIFINICICIGICINYSFIPLDITEIFDKYTFGISIFLTWTLVMFVIQAILPIEQSIPRSTYIHPPAVNAAKGAF